MNSITRESSTVIVLEWERPGLRLGFMFLGALAVLADHIRAALGDHQGGRVGVARGDRRHDRGVDHAQGSDAAHPQARIDHGSGVGVRAHPAGPHGMEDGGADVARGPREVLVAVAPWPGHEFLWRVRRERARGYDT